MKTCVRGVILLMSLASAVTAGCARHECSPPIRAYLRPAAMAKLCRVAMVDLTADNCDAALAGEVTDALYQAISARQLFHVDLVARHEPRCEGLNLQCREGSTYAELSEIRRALDCDAVLLGAVRQFDPYRMKVALDLRLLDVKNGRLVWGVDYVWDAQDRQLQRRLKHYAQDNLRHGSGPAPWRLALVSPNAFARFAAWEAACTMLPEENRPKESLAQATCRTALETAKNLTDYP